MRTRSIQGDSWGRSPLAPLTSVRVARLRWPGAFAPARRIVRADAKRAPRPRAAAGPPPASPEVRAAAADPPRRPSLPPASPTPASSTPRRGPAARWAELRDRRACVLRSPIVGDRCSDGQDVQWFRSTCVRRGVSGGGAGSCLPANGSSLAPMRARAKGRPSKGGPIHARIRAGARGGRWMAGLVRAFILRHVHRARQPAGRLCRWRRESDPRSQRRRHHRDPALEWRRADSAGGTLRSGP